VRFSNPTVPQFDISNCASCLCLRHAIIAIIKFIKFFLFTRQKFEHFSCHTKVSKVSINVAQAFLCPDLPATAIIFCTTTLATWLLGPGCRQLHQRWVISLTARVEPSDQVEMKSARNLRCGAWWNARLSAKRCMNCSHELLCILDSVGRNGSPTVHGLSRHPCNDRTQGDVERARLPVSDAWRNPRPRSQCQI
jgi:hypothetical protein